MFKPRSTLIAVSLFVLVVSMLAACLWPFDSSPRNNVKWLKNERGIRFAGTAIVASQEMFPSLARVSADKAITVEIAVRPSWINKRHDQSILTFSPEHGPPSLVIGALHSSIFVGLGRPDEPAQNNYRELSAGDAYSVGKTTLVTVSAGSLGTVVYLNGRLAAASPDAPLVASDIPLGRLLLGASPTGGSRWQGDILGLTIYNRALASEEVRRNHDALVRPGSSTASGDSIVASYSFAEGSGERIQNSAADQYELRIPPVFRQFRHAALSPPSRHTRGALLNPVDIVLNILGFIPFGLLASWTLCVRSKLSDRTQSSAVVVAGFALSLMFELTQAFLPTRSSSLVDLLTNTVGTALGAACFWLLAHRVSSRICHPGESQNPFL